MNYGDSFTFKIGIGESFTIKMRLNHSTGFMNCWTNKSKCNFVRKINREYDPSLFSMNCEGCSGTESWTFEGTKNGTDTIKIYSCFGGNCDFYLGDSIPLVSKDSIISKNIPYRQADYTIIVTVTD